MCSGIVCGPLRSHESICSTTSCLLAEKGSMNIPDWSYVIERYCEWRRKSEIKWKIDWNLGQTVKVRRCRVFMTYSLRRRVEEVNISMTGVTVFPLISQRGKNCRRAFTAFHVQQLRACRRAHPNSQTKLTQPLFSSFRCAAPSRKLQAHQLPLRPHTHIHTHILVLLSFWRLFKHNRLPSP